MSSDPGPGQSRLDAVRCPHCDEITMPNLLGDGSCVCSCAAERVLPPGPAGDAPGDGRADTMPAPVDEPGPDVPNRNALPADKGQFGRDVGTEDYHALRRPPRP
jgi:hypothetical protein